MQKYCSIDCRAPLLTCSHCERPFRMLRLYVDRGQGKFCSVGCRKAAFEKGVSWETRARTCDACGAIFYATPCEVMAGKKRTTCSKACQKSWRVTRPCAGCGISFEMKAKESQSQSRRYCSRHCYRAHVGSGGATVPATLVRCVLAEAGFSFEREVRIAKIAKIGVAKYGPWWTADFLIDKRIVLEVDGAYWHEKTRSRDAERDRQMAAMGLVVVRVSDVEVRRDPMSVLRALSASGLDLTSVASRLARASSK